MKLIKYVALLCTPIALFSCGKTVTKYSVNFDLNGGIGKIPTQTVNEGECAIKPTNPERESTKEKHYTFNYWSCGGGKFDFATPIIKNITLKAEWTETERIYHTVSFDTDGGEPTIDPIEVEDGKYVTEPTEPTKKSTHDYNYEFEYWMNSSGAKFEFTTTPITSDITLKAKWKETARIYHTVSFDTDGGEPTIDPIEVENGKYVTKPGIIPEKAKTQQYTYTFKEWQLNGAEFKFETTPITSDITLKAKYNETINSYTVTFDSGEGTEVSSQTVEYGSCATEPSPAPTRPSTHDYNYTLEYWMNPSGSKFEFTTPITGNITLKAKWKATARIYHEVSFNTDGGTPSIESIEVEDGEYATEPETVPVKASTDQYTYKFKEWQLNGGKFYFETTPITGNITLKAKYTETVNKYTVTFDTGGGSSIDSQTVEYGSYATKPEVDPIKQTELMNYPFVRWEDENGDEFNFANTKIVGPTTIYAKWDSPVEWWSDNNYINSLTTDDVGITRGVTVNSKVHKVRLIGINHDDLANSDGKAHTTWEFATLFSNSSGDAELCMWDWNGHYYHVSNDYINYGMRKSIDGGGTAKKTGWKSQEDYSILSKLPNSLQSKLKTVTKYVNKNSQNAADPVETPYDTSLFQLSTLEMGYSDTNAEKTNVSRYDYYNDATGQTSIKRIKRDYNGGTSMMWLRSPYAAPVSSASTIWNRGWNVDSNGKIDYSFLVLSSTNYYAVAPAFCL